MSTKKSTTNKKSSNKSVKQPANDLNSLLDQRAALEQKIKKAEEKAKKDVKVGDYLIIINIDDLGSGFQIGQFYEVKEIDRFYFKAFNRENQPVIGGNWNFNKTFTYYRKATESEVQEYKEKLARDDLKRRFEENKKDLETIKIGDYLVFVPEFAYFAKLLVVGANTLNKVTGFAENGEVKLNGSEVSWIKFRFRRATQQEINDFEVKNIKVGNWVYILKSFGDLVAGEYFKVTNLNGSCHRDKNYFSEAGFQIDNRIVVAKSSINDNWRIASLEEVEKHQKEQEEKNNKEFKVDDYVVALKEATGFKIGHIYKVKSFFGQGLYGLDVYVDSLNSTTNGWGKQFFRKATPDEIAKYQSKFEYKVEKDDYLINKETGNFIRIIGECENSHYFASNFFGRGLKSQFRLASSAEIESYLRAEADKKGYKVGVKVKYYEGSLGLITAIKFAATRKEFLSSAYESSKNILYATWESEYGINAAEINDYLKIVKEEIVSINGYNAEYYKDYIQFGCAKISMDILYKLSMCFDFQGFGNRVLEGDIKIGAGTFNKSIIDKLLKVHKEKFGK